MTTEPVVSIVVPEALVLGMEGQQAKDQPNATWSMVMATEARVYYQQEVHTMDGEPRGLVQVSVVGKRSGRMVVFDLPLSLEVEGPSLDAHETELFRETMTTLLRVLKEA